MDTPESVPSVDEKKLTTFELRLLENQVIIMSMIKLYLIPDPGKDVYVALSDPERDLLTIRRAIQESIDLI